MEWKAGKYLEVESNSPSIVGIKSLSIAFPQDLWNGNGPAGKPLFSTDLVQVSRKSSASQTLLGQQCYGDVPGPPATTGTSSSHTSSTTTSEKSPLKQRDLQVCEVGFVTRAICKAEIPLFPQTTRILRNAVIAAFHQQHEDTPPRYCSWLSPLHNPKHAVMHRSQLLQVKILEATPSTPFEAFTW